VLRLDRATVGDWSALAKLPLTELYVSASNLVDLAPLAALKNLKVLWLMGTDVPQPLQNLDVLSGMKRLETLSIDRRPDLPCAWLAKMNMMKELSFTTDCEGVHGHEPDEPYDP